MEKLVRQETVILNTDELVICDGTMVTGTLEPNNGLAVSKGKIRLLKTGEELPPGVKTISAAEGLYIAPGLIDLHVHGGYGADVLDGTCASLEQVTAYHGRYGTTGLVAAVAAAPLEQMADALGAVARFAGQEKGARILGTHLEGPFLNPRFSGALEQKALKQPDLKTAEDLLAAGCGMVKMVTLAPELPGGLEVVEMLAARGVIPALGHSGASFAETIEAGRMGLRHVTHIFNAMAGLHHREPGPAGAAIFCKGFSVDVIADGVHIHPFLLKMLWQLKRDGLLLISDAVAAAGLPEGRYRLWGRDIEVSRNRATMAGGRLAGSTVPLLAAMKNMARACGLTLPQAVRLASTNPARILGLTSKGRIADGFDADLILLDQDYDLHLVMAGGRVLFSKI
ncbi:MAG TPA: N-acetylglucosamine-6-phosphate deacetylase [Bacillota bacterium]|jgi:N-acetylglucosamine-6-phosphate deacetylase|nr:N-acetylglucosamine-6-phosphate deacetylase [Peptococcaceae bacterium MAG4]NLW39131.1 N-acetylglucosamine-6-phosphate deacetylase [Peptococcaceae bacterium]HPZ42421.1 N-acetylglucosamine-6-phosphate deacetylase [Bacillota bacterium]HQD75087.1 N-acetylglucosamine-6-phosphate deacetylase [Bacillota bacterium]HUM57644.1 N-acetylglucosamine-6-phosphate deacetylase [Bacillota bacterium]